MKTKKKKKETAFFLKDKPHRQMTFEQYQFQARGRTDVVIRRRRGEQDKRIYFSKQVE
ncbi:MAG: hypothetical protein JRG99_10320 [Deltaproteobacteria bacterium]|nr:hypothetical protein [Deltaproteobacteria bacterium]